MSTITRERLQWLANISGRDDIEDIDGGEIRELARIALASLEAEPVAFIGQRMLEELTDGARSCGRVWPEVTDKLSDEDRIPLFAAPPAPVSVPDELTREEYKRRFMEEDNFDDTFRGGWNACRAAMLQCAEPVSQRDELPAKVIDALEKALQAMSFMGDTLNALDAVCEEDVEYVTPAFEAVREVLEGNSPVIQDGWVACSERMPEESGRYWCYVEEQNDLGKSHYQWNCSWNGDRWWVESENGGRVTHWQQLPSPPAK